MKKWKLLTIAAMSMALSAAAFLGIPQTASAATQGVNVQTHTQAEIISYLQQQGAKTTDPVSFRTAPSYQKPYIIGELSTDTKNSALAMVNQIRYIAGLPEVTMDTEHQSEIQAAALVNAANDKLSHTPDRPEGLSDATYFLACSGASMANLSMGRSTLNLSILNGWMGDYTGSNIEKLGHRRWVLNPTMGKTCFGSAGKYYAMYAFDRSGTSTATGVVWPAQQMPVEYFDTQYAWSYSLGKSVDESAVKVTLTKRGANQSWSFSSASADGPFYVNNGGYGQSGCIIFRPNNVTYSDGDVFDVSITGLSTPVQYSVTFFSLNPTPKVLTNGVARNDVLTAGGSLSYQFTASGSGYYTFFSEGNVDTKGYLYSSGPMQGNQISYSDDDGYNHNFSMRVFLSSNQTVYLSVAGMLNAAGPVKIMACANYTVYFNAKGGYGVPSTMTKLHNVDLTIPTTEPSKACTLTFDANGGTVKVATKTINCTFKSWNADYNGSGTNYAPGSTFSLNSSPTLYAQWEVPAVGSLPVPTRSGYVFDGWYLEQVSGPKITSDSVVTDSTKLYAHWKHETTALKFDEAVSCTMTKGSSTYFTFTAPADGMYLFMSEGSLDTYGVLYTNDNFESSYDGTGYGGTGKNFCLKRKLKTGDTIYLGVSGYEGLGDGSYTVIVKGDNIVLGTPVVSGLSNTANGVQVKWNAVPGASQYRVFYKTGTGAWTGYNNTNGTSMTVTGLTAGKTYSFTVRCLSADGKTYTSNYNTTGKSILYQPAMLAKPEISSLNSNAAGVQVSWGAVSGASQYRVFYKTATGAWTTFGEVKGTGTTVTGLTSGTTYSFLVRCLSADGKAYTSDYDASKAKSHTYIAQPEVSSLSNAANGVLVKWNAVKGAAQYRVFYKTGTGAWTGYNNTTGTSMTVTGLTAGTTYSFTVRCVSADGKTFTSTYNTTGKSIVYQPASAMLAKPEITALNSNAAGVQVSWGAVSGASQYRVFYKTATGAWTTFGEVKGTGTTVTGLTSGTTYSFLVRCLSADGKAYTSDYDASKAKSHTYIAQPAVSSVANTASGVQVKWNAVPGAAQYRVFYKTGSGAWTGYNNTTGTSMTVTGLTSGATYSFTVRCLSADGKTFTSTYDTTGKSIVVK